MLRWRWRWRLLLLNVFRGLDWREAMQLEHVRQDLASVLAAPSSGILLRLVFFVLEATPQWMAVELVHHPLGGFATREGLVACHRDFGGEALHQLLEQHRMHDALDDQRMLHGVGAREQVVLGESVSTVHAERWLGARGIAQQFCIQQALCKFRCMCVCVCPSNKMSDPGGPRGVIVIKIEHANAWHIRTCIVLMCDGNAVHENPAHDATATELATAILLDGVVSLSHLFGKYQ